MKLTIAVTLLAISGIMLGCCSTGRREESKVTKTPIVDRLENYRKYTNLHPEFEKAFDFLRKGNISQLELAKHAIDGEKLYCSLSKGTARTRDQAFLEAHRKYIDIQFVISGNEEMGYKPVADCRHEKEPYNPEKDIMFFKDPPEKWIKMPAGSFIILFPQDSHAPLVGSGEIHKAVVKVMCR